MAKKTVKEFIVKVDDKGTINKTTKKLGGLNKEMDNTANSANKVKRAQEGVGKASLNNSKGFAKQSQGLGGLVSVYATVAANVFALSAAYDVLKRNSNLQIMIEASADLSRTTGQNYNSVARSLRNVTKGALDMTQAMQAANLGLSGGATASQLGQIATIATKAAQVLGRSVPEAVTRMTQAVIKGEPELVDEFGIILRVTAATEKYAQAHGLAVKDLTAFQKSQAIVNQLIEQGNEKFSNAKIRENPYEQLAAGITDTGNVMLSFVSGPVGGFVSFVANNAALISAVILGIVAKIANLAIPTLVNFGATAAASFAEAGVAAEASRKKIVAEQALVDKALEKNRTPKQIREFSAKKALGYLEVDQAKLNARSNIGKAAKQGLTGLDAAAASQSAVRRALSTKAIARAIADKEKYIVVQKGVRVATADATKALEAYNKALSKSGIKEAAAEGVNALRGMQKTAHGLSNTWRGVKIEVLAAKAAFATGFSVVQSEGFAKIGVEARKVGASINNGTGLLSSFATHASGAAFAVGKIGTSFAALLGPASFWLFALTSAFQIIKAIAVWTGLISEGNIKFNKSLDNINTSYKEQLDITNHIEKQNDKAANSLAEQVAKHKANAAAMSGNLDLATSIADLMQETKDASNGWFDNLFSSSPLKVVQEELEKTDKLLDRLAPKFLQGSKAIKDLRERRDRAIADSRTPGITEGAKTELLDKADEYQTRSIKMLRDGSQEIASFYTEAKDAAATLSKLTSKNTTKLLNATDNGKQLTEVSKILRQFEGARNRPGSELPDIATGLDSPALRSLGIEEEISTRLLEISKTTTSQARKTLLIKQNAEIIEEAAIKRQTRLIDLVKKEITLQAKIRGETAKLKVEKEKIADGSISAIGREFDAQSRLIKLQIDKKKQEEDVARQNENLLGAEKKTSIRVVAAKAYTAELVEQGAVLGNNLASRTKEVRQAQITLGIVEQERALWSTINAGLQRKLSLQKTIEGSVLSTNATSLMASLELFRLSKEENRVKAANLQLDLDAAQARLAGVKGGAEFSGARKVEQDNVTDLEQAIKDNTEATAVDTAIRKDALVAKIVKNSSIGADGSLAATVAGFQQATRASAKSTDKSVTTFIKATNASIDKFSETFTDNIFNAELSFSEIFKGLGQSVAETFVSVVQDGLKKSMSQGIKELISSVLPGYDLKDTPLIASNGQLIGAILTLNGTLTGVAYSGGLSGGSASAAGGLGSIGGLTSLALGSDLFSSTVSVPGFNPAAMGTGPIMPDTGFLDSAMSGIGSFFSNFSFFAKGGVTNQPSIAGEAGPEAVVPLPDGRSIPVQMTGGGSGSSGTVINVSVSSEGGTQSDTEGKGDNSTTQSAEFGRVIAGMIKDEMTKQQRPGGLLYANKQGNRR